MTVARHLPTVARVLYGLAFAVFGLAGFIDFMPKPKELPPEGAMNLVGAFMASGYLLKLIKGTELVCGLLLVTNLWAPLALAVLAPIVLNIVAFHVFLAPDGAVIALVFLAFELYLAWAYRAAFRPMLAMRVRPT